jgi:autotransporter passenger strand-loop-strand repeat protein
MASNYVVSSGVTSSGITLSAGDLMTVSSGGKTINISDGGEEQLLAGGVASNTTVTSRGVLIGGGGTDIGTVVDNAGLEQIGGSATDIDTVVSAGGVQWLYASATASSTTLSGGTQILGGVTSSIPFGVQSATGGMAMEDVVDAGGHEYVGTGAKTSGTVVHSGGTQQVGGSTTWSYYYGLSAGSSATMSTNLSGGVASNTVVSSGGLETVASGGTTISTTTYGEEQVAAGGVASATTVESGGVIIAGSGTESGTVVKSGGLEQIGGGVDTAAVVSSGGVEWLYGSATASSTTLSGGTQIIGGVTSSIPFGVQATPGGTAIGDVVDSGGAEYVGTSATASGTVVNSGGTQQVGGSTTWSYYHGLSAGVSATMSTNLSGGVASNTTVSSGGTENVSSGGTASSIVINDGGNEYVYSGGVANDTTVNSGGALYDSGTTTGTILDASGAVNSAIEDVYSGATAVSTTITSGGIMTVFSGGTATDTIISGGSNAGALYVSSGGSSLNATITDGNLYDSGTTTGTTLIVSYERAYGTAVSTTISSGGKMTVFSGGTATDTTVSSGGTENVNSGGVASGTTISSGGVLDILSGGSATDTILQIGGTIDVGYVPYVSGATATLNSSTDVLTVTDGGNTLTYQMADSYTGDTFLVSNDSNNNTQITLTPCFCAGTRILTDRGEVPVEQLAVSDRVMTADGMPRPVKWVGHRSLDLSRHPHPDLVRPVLIRTGAIAEGMPHRDLYVSPDHALLLDDVLIPARLLVNGASIRSERECRTVVYYHVELNAHDILLAENLPAESYLDTGNRVMFENTGMPMLLHPDLANDQSRRVAQSCRPFADAPAVVEPIWHRLAQRSVDLGLALPAAPQTTDDPALHVVIGGRTIRPLSQQGGRYVFMLPATEAPMQLVSLATRPSSLRPWVEDRRRLGVMVSGLTLKRGADVDVIPLDHPLLSRGWWDVEGDHSALWRWTDGNAMIPALIGGPVLLEVTLAHTLDYPPSCSNRHHA